MNFEFLNDFCLSKNPVVIPLLARVKCNFTSVLFLIYSLLLVFILYTQGQMR